jgi:hypothetical protein
MNTSLPLKTEPQAAAFIGVQPRTLRKWRTEGDGPAFVRISARCIRYRPEDLKDWIAEKTHASTSEYLHGP